MLMAYAPTLTSFCTILTVNLVPQTLFVSRRLGCIVTIYLLSMDITTFTLIEKIGKEEEALFISNKI